MKKTIILLFLALGLMSMNAPVKKHRFGLLNEVTVAEKFDIKIKNDLDD